jgi:ribose transport system permease protein
MPLTARRQIRLPANHSSSTPSPPRSSADPLAGQSFELDAIAAAVIGGTSLSGGRGTIIGTLVGALILTLLDNVLGINGVSDNDQLIVKGLIVVLAVVLQRPDFFRSIAGIFTKSQRSS